MRRTVATWAGLLSSTVLLTGVLAGCSGGEPADPATASPAASPEASPSPTVEPSPTVTKPERPAAMANDDADGAAAAAVYFATLWKYTMSTGDTAEWEAMSGNGCGFCESGLKQAREVARKGYTYEGGKVTARVLTRYERDTATGIWPVDIESTMAPVTITTEDGDEIYSSGQEVTASRFEVGQRDGAWVIVTVADVPKVS